MDHLYNAYPEYQYTLLVRSEKYGKVLKAKYPSVNLIYGSLEDSDLIRGAAKDADVVVGKLPDCFWLTVVSNISLDTADSSDNVPGAVAIAKGLEEGHSATHPGYWIHLSGTGILMWYDIANGRGGESPAVDQIYHDVDGVERLFNLPEDALHRNVDMLVQDAMSDAVRAMILSPPTIYDTGSGAINRRSIQIPDMVRATLKNGYAPIVGKGLTEWDNVNVHDLGSLYVKLVEATQDPSKNSNPDIFGSRAYFLAENGTHLWADVAKWIADECHRQGYLAESRTKVISQEEAGQLEGIATASFGLNSRGVAARAKQFLGWKPAGRPLKDTIAEVVEEEARGLGITPQYKS